MPKCQNFAKSFHTDHVVDMIKPTINVVDVTKRFLEEI